MMWASFSRALRLLRMRRSADSTQLRMSDLISSSASSDRWSAEGLSSPKDTSEKPCGRVEVVLPLDFDSDRRITRVARFSPRSAARAARRSM